MEINTTDSIELLNHLKAYLTEVIVKDIDHVLSDLNSDRPVAIRHAVKEVTEHGNGLLSLGRRIEVMLQNMYDCYY